MSIYKLVCFDLDGTIIDDTVFVWQTIHDFLGTCKDERKRAQEGFFAGKITYRQWAEHDIMMWKRSGARRDTIFDAIRPMRLMAGARETLATLKRAGLTLGVISGSLDIALEHVLPDYADFFDHVFINRLRFSPDGEILSIATNPYDIDRKAEGLEEIVAALGISLGESVFVGDHFNDLSAARKAGLSIAFNCKSDELARVSHVVIREPDLRLILPHVLEA